MSTLSSPAPFGDVIEPSFEEDASRALGNALVGIRREFGATVHACASYAVSALAVTDGMTAKDLGDCVSFELALNPQQAPELVQAIVVLQRCQVIQYRSGRLYLNPALVEMAEREAHR